MFDHDSKISCYVHEYSHIMDFEGARVVGHEDNFHERLLLEVWFSIKGPLTGNDHISIPEVIGIWHAPTSCAPFSRT